MRLLINVIPIPTLPTTSGVIFHLSVLSSKHKPITGGRGGGTHSSVEKS